MARQRNAGESVPKEFAYLTEAARLGADLRPALQVLMLLPDTRKDLSAWLRERASVCDPVVRTYLDESGRQLWDDGDIRIEVVRILDSKRPRLPRRRSVGMSLLLKTPRGYVAACGFVDDARMAQKFTTGHEWKSVVARLLEQDVAVTPEFEWYEELWRGLDPPPPPADATDPWASALQTTKAVPGCAWIPISPQLRKEMGVVVTTKGECVGEPESFKEMLRAAARFGHPLFTVYADLARRNLWDAGFLSELVQLDLYHARFRDPPGEVPLLQPLVGPFRVLCGPDGFWDGRGWTARLLDAQRFSSHPQDEGRSLTETRQYVAEQTGVIPFVAEVEAHPERPSAARTS